MSTHRRVFAFLASLLVLSAVRGAQAQATTTGITLATTPVTHNLKRTGFRTADQINYNDCHNDDIMTFSLVLPSNHNMYALEVWAGVGCNTDSTRQMPGLTSCWRLEAPTPNSASNSALAPIHVRDLLYGPNVLHSGGTAVSTGGTGGTDAGGTSGTDAGGTSGTGGTGGTGGDTGGGGTTADTGGTTSTTTQPIIPTGTIVTGTDQSTCDDPSNLPVVSQLQVYFMLVDGNETAQGGIGTYTAHYKLQAPNPPDTVTADIGDTMLPLQFSYASGNQTDTTISGYQFYCDPPPGEAALADAGIVPIDVLDAPTGADCQPTSTQLVPNMRADDKFKCGNASLSATAGNATGLVNGVLYNVGVAATDTYQNVGKISTLTCNMPQPVTGFFKAYRAAGGKGGGGFCSFSTHREPLPLIALLGLASCLVLRRRRAA